MRCFGIWIRKYVLYVSLGRREGRRLEGWVWGGREIEWEGGGVWRCGWGLGR